MGEARRNRGRQRAAEAVLVACACTLAAAVLATATSCGPGDSSPSGTVAEAGAAGDSGLVIDAGGDVAEPPNGEALCPAANCNYQSQAGCSATETCWPHVDDVGQVFAACVQPGAGTAGAPCSAWTDCARGHGCVGSACRRLCCGGDWSVCGPDEGCVPRLSLIAGSGVVPTGVDFCYPMDMCDVLDPEACSSASGMTCQIVDARGKTDCAAAGSGQVGDPCSPQAVCAAGLACVGGVCVRLCRAVPNGEPACPEDEGVCVHYSRNPEGVGECKVIPD